MRRVTILCVGRLKERFYIEAAAEYAKRLSRFCTLDIVEAPEERLPDRPSQAQIEAALKKEAAVLRGKLPGSAYVTALCIEGRMLDSGTFAREWDRLTGEGGGHTAFLIGGSYGLDSGLKAEAQARLSLSPMTFPHHLARVMLLEQLYRAFQITSGGRYHK